MAFVSEGPAGRVPSRLAPRAHGFRAFVLAGVLATALVVSVVGLLVLYPPHAGCALTFTEPAVPMFFATTIDHWNASVKITAASVCDPPSYFRFILSIGSSRANLAALMPAGSNASVVVNGTPFRVAWVDATENGVVDAGDTFRVSGDGVHLPAPPGPSVSLPYGLDFRSSDGQYLGKAGWEMPFLPPAPSVILGLPTLRDGNATIPILNVSMEYDPWNYWLNLAVGSAAAIPTTMPGVSGPPGSRVFIQGVQYNLPWVDADRSGTVSAGDGFIVNGNGTALPRSTVFTFSLLWMDESPIAGVTWTT